jgi:phosphoglucosamine mutase
VAAAEEELGEGGRVLVRASGTEPVIRVMIEGERPELIERLARHIAHTIEAGAHSVRVL